MTQDIPEGATHHYPKGINIKWYKKVGGVWHYYHDSHWKESSSDTEWIDNNLVEIKP